MDQLIPIISRLQEVLQTIDPSKDCTVDLPRLVVVGAQSSGKSSVLETLVKRDFLPRGKDIVTRRPLILQLVRIASSNFSPSSFNYHSNNGHGNNNEIGNADGNNVNGIKPFIPTFSTDRNYSSSKNEGLGNREGIDSNSISNDNESDWAEFGHASGKIFKDFDKVREEIERETIRVAGNKKSVSREPIYLRIYSKKVVDLTLVDLPGMTKIPIGDQPLDIENQLRSLILEYISKSNSIILAVTPANMDLVNSDALKLAKEVDPLGLRTIGILTKLDLMDAGTNALEILTNKGDFKLKLGYIGLVMRSQYDINVNKRIEDALKAEREFFRQYYQYRNVADRCGAIFLAKELNKILINHIKEQLPFIKIKINELIVNTQNELQGCGELALLSQPPQKSSLLLKLATEYVSDFDKVIQGTFRGSILSQELIGGSRLNSIFNESFQRSMIEIDPISGLSHNDIRNAIRNATGPKPALFVPEASFELLVKRQLRLLVEPSEKCIQQSFEELVRVVSTIEKRGNLKRFPILTKRINEVSLNLIRECLDPCEKMIHNLLEIEGAYINTNHPDFWKNGQLLQSLGKVVEEKKKRETINNSLFFDSFPSTNFGISSNFNSNFSSVQSSTTLLRGSTSDDIILNPINTTESNSFISNTFNPISNPHSNAGVNATFPTMTASSPSNNNGNGNVNNSNTSNVKQNTEDGGLLSYLFPSSQNKSSNQGRSDKKSQTQSPLTNNNTSRSAPLLNLVQPPPSQSSTTTSMNSIGNSNGNNNQTAIGVSEGMENINSNVEIQFILNLIQSYFQIVKKNLMDAVPKSIMYFLVNQVQDQLPARIVCELYKEELLEELLVEDESITQLRDKCKRALEIYRQASEMLMNLGDQLY